MTSAREKAFLLRLLEYKDQDLIAHFLGEKTGQMQAVLYGAKRAKNAFGHQPGDLLELDFWVFEAQDFIKIKTYSALEVIRPEQFSYPRFVIHSYLLELVSRLAQPGHAPGVIFGLLEAQLAWNWPAGEETYFLLWALGLLSKDAGFGLDFQRCRTCGKPSFKLDTGRFVPRKMTYQLDLEGLVCADCEFPTDGVDGAAIKVLWLSGQPDFLSKNHAIPSDLQRRLVLLLNRRLLAGLEIEPRSLGLLERQLGG